MDTTSTVESIRVRDRHYYIKRDDLIDPLLSGNKYRKLYSLLQTPAKQYSAIASYGGTQSNAMLSIAALCKQKGWRFDYTCKTVSSQLKAEPSGNLRVALDLGMQLHEVSPEHYQQAVQSLAAQRNQSTLFLAQGGADPLARCGIDKLAQEIRAWQHANQIQTLHVITPSGTGTTAYYLACALAGASVLTTPVVGDKGYLLAQMAELGTVPDNLHILEQGKKYHFAKPYAEFLAVYYELHRAGVDIDLIYGAQMWHALLPYADKIDGTILYVHSGGLIGNETMLARYRHKGLITD
ncbi:MAG: pyridoxal-phosphate dependent enzyme [Mariprofundus sp.]